MLRKILCRLLLLLFLLAVSLFPLDIFLLFVKAGLRLNHICFDSLRWERGGIVITHGKIKTQKGGEFSFESGFLRPYVAGRLCGDLSVKSLSAATLPCHTFSFPSLPFFSELHFFLTEGNFKDVLWEMEGVITEDALNAQAVLQLEKGGSPIHLEFSCAKEGGRSLCLDLGNQNLPKLVALLQHFLPSLQQWHFSKGMIQGKGVLQWQGDLLTEARGSLTAEEFTGENHELAWKGSCGHFFAEIALFPQKLPQWEGLFEVENAALSLYEINPEFWQGMWNLDISHSKIVVSEGKVKNSLFEAALMGMKGELLVDWSSPDELLRFTFKGDSQEICPQLPEAFQPSFAKAFPEDSFCLKASVKPAKKGVEMEGELVVCDESKQSYYLAFGCRFGEPISFGQEVDTFLDSLKEQFFLSHKRLGWFRGKSFPAEKFLAPFLLRNVKIDASGKVDFEATFDDRFLVIKYEVRDFCLESPHFILTSPYVGHGNDAEDAAIHYFDFDTKKQMGILPLRNTSYRQKNYDLTFTECYGRVYFEDNAIHIDRLTANWQDLFFSGEVDLDVRKKDGVELLITTDRVAGPVEEAETFLSHIVPSRVWGLPLEGFLECGEKGLSFRILFHPKAQLLEGKVQGHMCANMHAASFSLSHYETFFAYNFSENALLFSDGEALFSWDQENATPYHLCIPELSFVGFPKEQISLKMDVRDGDKKLFSLTGKTEEKGLGRKIIIEGGDFSLSAIQEGCTVWIVGCRYKQFTGSGALSFSEEMCRVSSLQIAAEPLGSLALSGELSFTDWTFTGELPSFKVDLKELSHLSEPIEKELVRWDPCGELKGRGIITYNIAQKKLELTTLADFTGLQFANITFGEGANLCCHYSSELGLTVQGLAVELPQDSGVEKYKLGQFQYDFEQHKILFDTFDFTLPPEKLPWIADIIMKLFPDRIHPAIVEWALALKQNEPLVGSITIELYPQTLWFSLRLKDGGYFFSDRVHTLRNFCLVYDPLELRLSTQYLYHDRFYDIDLSIDAMTMSHGQVAISNEAERAITTWEKRSNLGWYVKEVRGSLCGLTFDLKSQENCDFANQICLSGRVGCDLQKMAPLLPDKINYSISKLGLGSGYFLSGEFFCPKNDLAGISFTGMLYGENFLLGMTHLDSFYAEAYYQSGFLQLKNLKINDWAGSLIVESASLYKENNLWKIAIPTLSIDNLRLSRLRCVGSLANKKQRPLVRSLFITSCELLELNAVLGDPLSFRGRGALQFTNLPKKYFLSPFLYLPTEITARIGLDLSLLIPARGRIDYEFKEGKVYLNKFHKMFSEGKRSRFYLDEGYPAYIDFDGNLHLKVKMKQYNLLMKLAEFFTITVKGTVFKPHYTFTNQFGDVDDEDDDYTGI